MWAKYTSSAAQEISGDFGTLRAIYSIHSKQENQGPMKITKKYLQKMIKEETGKALREGSGEMLGFMSQTPANLNRTTIDEAYQLLTLAMRAFYDDNDRLGVVTAIKEAEEAESTGDYPLAIEAAQIRQRISTLLEALRERQSAMHRAGNKGNQNQ